MNGFFLLGIKTKEPDKRECLYSGLSGVDCEQSAEKARKTGEYREITLLCNPVGRPMPTVPGETKCTKPTFTRGEDKVNTKPTPVRPSPKLIQEKEAKTRQERKRNRFQIPVVTPTPNAKGTEAKPQGQGTPASGQTGSPAPETPTAPPTGSEGAPATPTETKPEETKPETK